MLKRTPGPEVFLAEINAMETDAVLSRGEAALLRQIAKAGPAGINGRKLGRIVFSRLGDRSAHKQVHVLLFRVRQKTAGVSAAFSLVTDLRSHNSTYRLEAAAGAYVWHFRPVSGDVVDRIMAYQWAPLERLLLQQLLSTGATFIDTRTLAERIYAGRADGGPDYACSIVKVRVHAVRRVLRALVPGVRIASKAHHGYRLEVVG
jgi:hypothetical protein